MSVTVYDPDGLPVHVVYGIQPAEPLPMRNPVPINHAREKHRLGSGQRLQKGPAQILRLGHALFFVSDFQRTFEWYQTTFGMLPSDYIHDGEPENRLGGFLRCDRGNRWTDHHTIAIFNAPRAKIHHVSFEIQDFDAQYLSHEWLRSRGYRPLWGIGRHLLGSQIFDYWYDPYGNIVEHFTDGDLFRADKPVETHPAGPGSLYQWGPEVPAAFFA
jgi:catechol 2,3-dioxygenase-like lactoylglutathione lyase family enzyme